MDQSGAPLAVSLSCDKHGQEPIRLYELSQLFKNMISRRGLEEVKKGYGVTSNDEACQARVKLSLCPVACLSIA